MIDANLFATWRPTVSSLKPLGLVMIALDISD
jgi:hypothetical protein